jgi:signal transduction histidine kinase
MFLSRVGPSERAQPFWLRHQSSSAGMKLAIAIWVDAAIGVDGCAFRVWFEPLDAETLRLTRTLEQARRALDEASLKAPQRVLIEPLLLALVEAETRVREPTVGPVLPVEAALARRVAELELNLRTHDEFLSTLGHELRNSLSPLYMQAQYLLDVGRQAEGGSISTDWLIPRLTKFCLRLSKFLETLNRIMEATRISGGRLGLQLEDVDLSELLCEMCATLEREFSVARCELKTDISPHVVGLWDRMRLEQICGNLLSNALRYGAGKPIRVSLHADQGTARLTVQDQGIGIAEHDQARIFGRFERAVHQRHSGGFGIGLWIVRESCRAMGGDVTVQSKLGSGSSFIVTLPQRPRGPNG